MVQHHKYSISEVENLIPFERDLFLEMIKKHIEELEKEQNKEY